MTSPVSRSLVVKAVGRENVWLLKGPGIHFLQGGFSALSRIANASLPGEGAGSHDVLGRP